LAGYAFGKHGSDIFIPGALARAISKGLQTAEKTLLLESVTGLESAKIAEVIQSSQRTIILGEELGFTPHQMGQLKQAGNLENAVTNTFENISKNPAMLESIQSLLEIGCILLTLITTSLLYFFTREFLKPQSVACSVPEPYLLSNSQ
jgi:hypothetical protein